MDGEIRHFLNGKPSRDEFEAYSVFSLEAGISVESKDSMILTDQLMMRICSAPLLMKRFQ